MKTRVLSGIAMVPLALILYFRGYVLLAACALIGLVGVTEFFNGWEALGVKPSKKVAYASTIVLYIAAAFNLVSFELLCFWLVASIVAAMMVGWDIVNRGPYDAMATVLGIVYVVFFSFHMYMLDFIGFGIMTWVVVLASFGSDVMAYFTGFLIGKHKLCPNLSPKKTIEGAVGGVVGAGLLCTIFGYFFARDMLVLCAVLGVVGGAFSQAGDLTASAFKRKMGIKDYGNLIPGHGGIMDRFDSVIFVAPFVFYTCLIAFYIFNIF